MKRFVSIRFLSVLAFLLLAVPLTSQVSAQTIPEPFTLKHNTWEQLVVLGNPTSYSVNDLFGDDLDGLVFGTDWTIFIFDANIQDSRELSSNSKLDQGQGFWIIQISGESKELVLPADMPVATALRDNACETHSCIVQQLSARPDGGFIWHMIGSAYFDDVITPDIRIQNLDGLCDSGCSLTEAGTPVMWNWNTATEAYDNKLSEGVVSPWQAFWLPVLEFSGQGNPKLLIPDPNSGGQSNPQFVEKAEAFEFNYIKIYEGHLSEDEIQTAAEADVSLLEAGELVTIDIGFSTDQVQQDPVSLSANLVPLNIANAFSPGNTIGEVVNNTVAAKGGVGILVARTSNKVITV